MTELLSLEDLGAVLSAMDDLKDTFHNDNVKYIEKEESFTLMDNEPNTSGNGIWLDCRVTKNADTKSESKKDKNGDIDEHDIQIRFFARYLRANQLMVNDDPVFRTESTVFQWKRDKYLLKNISFDDSHFVDQVILVVCHCEKLQDSV